MSDKSRFQIRLPNGSLHVNASAPGYHSVERRIDLDANAAITIKLYPRRDLQESAAPLPLYDSDRWQPPPSWEPQPALVIGLGGTGRHVLTHLKKNLLDAGAGKISEKVCLTLLDTSDYEILDGQTTPVSFAGVSLAPEDIVELSEDLTDLKERLRLHPDSDPDLSSWFPAQDYHMRLSPDELNLRNGTRQRRPLARALLVNDLQKGVDIGGVDVLLLFDCSVRMMSNLSTSQPAVSKLQAAQDAAIHFVSQMDQASDRIAVAKFDKSSSVVTGLSNTFADIARVIHHLPDEDSVQSKETRTTFEQVFDDSHGRAKVVLLLSDGKNEQLLAMLDALRDHNIEEIIISLDDSHAASPARTMEMPNEKQNRLFASDADSLKNLMIQLARRMGKGSRIWRLLHRSASLALDGDELRVLLVCSLAGGFGSAVLADVAYLVKKVGWMIGAKSISVEAYVATDNVFSRIAPGQEILKANTFATIREVERFQLAQGFPFRMVYRRDDPPDENLFGKIQWRLLDEVYVFNRLPNVPPKNDLQSEGWYQPKLSVFPSMADAITFSLDKSSRTGALAQYRRAIQGNVTSEQWARGRSVVGGVGTYRYYLPIRDTYELLKARWARALLQLLLTGNSNNRMTISASQNREESEDNMERHVQLFVLGFAGYENPPCPPNFAKIGQVIGEGRSAMELLNDKEIVDLDNDTKSYSSYLNAATLVMLNGLKSSSVRDARTGKVGYVLEFLKMLREYLEDASAIFLALPNTQTLIARYIDETVRVEEDLKQSLLLCSKLLASSDDAPHGLIDLLGEREERIHKILSEQDAILTRQSLVSMSDIEEWYQTYFSESAFVDNAISRIQWVKWENTFVLSFNGWKSVAACDDVGIASFLDELLTYAGYAGQKLLGQDVLGAKLKKVLSRREDVETFTTELLQGSEALLSFSENKAPHAKYSLALGHHRAAETESLDATMRSRLIAERKLLRIETTDPYSLVLVQMLDVIPIDAVDTVDDARVTYSRWYGLLPGVSADPHAEPTSVFRAEKIGIALERQLQKELHKASRIFSPIILTALDSGNAARLYALAFASGWIQIRDNTVSITPPETKNIQIEIPDTDNLPRQFSPYVLGLVNFVIQCVPDDLKQLQSVLDQSNVRLWQPWTTPDWRSSELVKSLLVSDTQDADDFADIVALIVREEFLKRLKKAQQAV